VIVVGLAAVVGLLIGCACRARSRLTADALVVPVLVVAGMLVMSSGRPVLIATTTVVAAYAATLVHRSHHRHA